jgi:hypothetical protein
VPNAAVVLEPSRTVRELVAIALSPEQPGAVARFEDLASFLAAEGLGGRLLVLDSGFVGQPGLRERLLAGAHRVLVMTREGEGAVRGLEGVPFATVQKPVSRRTLLEALATLGAAPEAPAQSAAALPPAPPTKEQLEAWLGDELRKVVWRMLPELAEKIIREELAKLLAEEEEKDR